MQDNVTQADREAWREYLLVTGFLNMAEESRILDGSRDDAPGLQVFARHRLASTAQPEVKALVEALEMIAGHVRSNEHGYKDDYNGCKHIARAALAAYREAQP